MNQDIRSQILKSNKKCLQICAQRIKEGKLVAFPTETVYGLGANVFNVEACQNIFKTKGRPLTDPLIIHCHSIEQVQSIVSIPEEELKTFTILAESFWPGPLALIYPKKECISKVLTAQMDFAAVRIPNNKTALQLIKLSDLPIAAPSANKFNHISPVTAQHVQSDFPNDDILILDEGQTTYGMESTLIKVYGHTIEVYWLGSLCVQKLKQVLDQKLNKNYRLIIPEKYEINENTNQICPGQFKKHYSPYISTFLLSSKNSNSNKIDFDKNNIIIDFKRQNKVLKGWFIGYYDLSPRGSIKQAIRNLYLLLRRAEQNKNVEQIFITNIQELNQLNEKDKYLYLSLIDKIQRATQGNLQYL